MSDHPIQKERKDLIFDKIRRELGPIINKALDDDSVIEIMLNSDGTLWLERFGKNMECVGSIQFSVAKSLIGTIASYLDTSITVDHPILECELPNDGSRFEALIPPVVAHPTFTIRKKAKKVFTLQDYVDSGTLSNDQKKLIEECIALRKNILVVGGTGSGKTTFTNAIIEGIVKINPEHRIVIIEDTAEIQCSAENNVILRATADVDMLKLLKATMRLRPDRILVGEVRGKEALDLLKAWNTGHPGGIATVHANGALAGLIRMEQLVAEGTSASMQSLIAEAVNVVVFIEKAPTLSGRQIKEIIEITGFDQGNQKYLYFGVENEKK